MNPARLVRFFLSAFVVLICIPSTIALGASRQNISLPLIFEENQGQVPQRYRYVSHHSGIETMFLREGVDFLLPGTNEGHQQLGMRFIGSGNDSHVVATDPLKSHTNYLLGADSSRWIRGVANYGQIEYKSIYPGVDLVFYGHGSKLEHDFQVAAGADPSSIVFRLNGAEHVALGSEGDLEIHIGGETLVLKKPVAYQTSADGREPVGAAFALAKDGAVRFRLGAYDVTRPLVIDPVFTFSTYLDGTDADNIAAVTTDSGQNIYVTGFTRSTDFPTQNAVQAKWGGADDIFITKLDPTGHTLIYSTYLGGSDEDFGATIAVDSNGDAIVGGISSSTDFPHAGSVPSSSYQTTYSCYFVASLKPDGSAFNYVGKIGGGQGSSYANGNNGRLTVDVFGNAYLTGVTDAPNFQITPGTLTSTVPGYPDTSTFILKVDPTGKLLYSTVIPGNAAQDPLSVYVNWFLPTGIAVDSSGQVVVAGTGGQGLPTTQGVISTSFPNAIANVESPAAGYILQLNASASAINYGTYIPGTDTLGGMTVDNSGNVYITGGTSESSLPVTASSYQKSLIAGPNCTCNSGYIVELNAQGSAVLAATYLSGAPSQGNGGSSFSGIALDSHSNVYVGGETGSANFPLQNPFTSELETSTSSADMVLAEMSPDLSSLTFGSFLSSTDGTFPGSIFSSLAIDSNNNLIVTGTTFANDFPTTSGSFQTQPPPPPNPNVGYSHTFISKIDMATAAPSVCLSAWNVNLGQTAAGSSSTQTMTVTNCGNTALDFTSITSSVSTITASQGCGSIAPGASCPVTLSFAPVDDNTSSGTITFSDNAAISPQVIQVSGQGVAPDLEPASIPFDFGHLLVGTQGPAVGLFLFNRGNAPLAISHVAISGSGFSIAQNGCTGTLPTGAPCVVQLAFSPPTADTLSGSLAITSNDPVHPQLVVALTGTGDSAYGVPAISMVGTGGVPQQTLQINNGPATLQVTGSNFYPASIVKLNGVSQQTTFESNGLLQVTIAASSLTSLGEVPLTVVNPAPGGGEGALVTITPYQVLGINPSFIVSVPATNLMYAAIPASSTTDPNTVVPIDPTTGTLGTPIPVGNNPVLMAASNDGSYLYVALAADQTVRRINMTTNTVDRTFPYSPNPFCTGCSILAATDLKTIPGSPQEVVLSQGSMVSLYNDNGLVNYVPNAFVEYNAPSFNSIAFAGNPLALYALPFTDVQNPFFTTVPITGSGLQYTEFMGTNYGPPSGTGSQVISDGTLLYTDSGEIWNPATQAMVATLPVSTTYSTQADLTLDNTSNNIYFVGFKSYQNYSAIALSSYGLKSLTLQGDLEFPQINSPEVSNVIRWRADGLAFLVPGLYPGTSGLYLTRSTALTGPPVQNPAPALTSISPSGATAGAPTFTLTVNGTGFVSASVVSWNGNALATTYVSATQLTASVPASELVSAQSVSITVTNPAPGGGTSSALVFTIIPTVPNVSLSTSSISFGDIALGASSSAQSITITNAGNAALSVASIAVSGDFSQTNNCGTTLAINATCQVAVAFTPTATGQRTGTLTITDNASGSPQAVTLTGNGTEQAAISPGNRGSTTVTVSSGMAATYNLTLSGGTGLSGAVSLACTGAPQNASCSIAPATLTLPVGGSVNFTVTVSTTATQAAYLPQRSNIMMAGLGLLSLGSVPVLLLLRRQLRISTKTLYAVCVFTMLAVLTGCGGGSHIGGTQLTNPSVTPPGTYTLTVTASAGGATVAQKLTLIVQ